MRFMSLGFRSGSRKTCWLPQINSPSRLLFRSCPSPWIIALPVHFPEDNIHAPEDDDYIGHSLAETHVFKDGQVDEAGRPDTIAIGIWRTIADEIKTQLA